MCINNRLSCLDDDPEALLMHRPLQVLLLALRMQLDGIVPQIMSLSAHMLEEKPLDPATGKSWSYPPTYFMHMALDQGTAQQVSADIAVIKSKQVGCMH